MLQLYTYFRSSAAFRVRIALNLKGLPYQAIPLHLLRGGGEQHRASFEQRNPLRLVPVLLDDSLTLTQSLAIIEYLEDAHPLPALLPPGAAARAQVRALALCIACDIHPLNNLRVLRYLKSQLGIDDEARSEWSRHWIELGLGAIERMLREGASSGSCCYGDLPSLADCCLVPQVFNAQRVECELARWPTIQRIHEHCMQLPAFQLAAPAAQIDAE